MDIPSLRRKIADALGEELIEIYDDSQSHVGHIGSKSGSVTHIKLRIISSKFANLSRVARHRMVYAILDDAFSSGLHAVEVVALTPEEAQPQR